MLQGPRQASKEGREELELQRPYWGGPRSPPSGASPALESVWDSLDSDTCGAHSCGFAQPPTGGTVPGLPHSLRSEGPTHS